MAMNVRRGGNLEESKTNHTIDQFAHLDDNRCEQNILQQQLNECKREFDSNHFLMDDGLIGRSYEENEESYISDHYQ